MIVEKEFTRFTRSEVIKASTWTVGQICNEDHAEALYRYHLANKVNFTQKEPSISNQLNNNTHNGVKSKGI